MLSRGEGLALGRTVRTGPYRSVPWPYGRTDGIDHAVKKCYREKKFTFGSCFTLTKEGI